MGVQGDNFREMRPASGRWRSAAAGLLLGLAAIAPATADPPRRVVSFNLCADQLVVALADPEQIVALSPYAADPALSAVADAARPFPRINWQAESTLALAPDLILISEADRPATRRMLAAQGVRFAEVALVSDIPAARAQIQEVAALLGHPERGARLVADLDAAERRLAIAPRPTLRTALIVERSGFTAGPSSLAVAMIVAAGLAPPPGAPGGLGGYVSLERMLVLRPDLLVLKDPPTVARDQGALYVTHPALAAAYPSGRRISLPSRFVLCGGSALVAGLNHIAEVLTSLSAAPR